MFGTIAVALDSSDAAKAAVEDAVKLATLDHCGLLLVNVFDLVRLVAISGYQTPYQQDAIEDMRLEGEDLLKTTAAAVAAQHLAVTTVCTEGDPADEILKAAEEHACGLIAIGTHGRSGISRLFLGSVAEAVLRRSSVPVLVTPVHEHA